MATFTMNSEKNFVQAPAARGVFDKAFGFSVALVVIVGGIWAAERVLLYLTDKQIAEYQATTKASFESVSSEDASSVHDVTSRIVAIGKQGESSVNPGEILAALEKSTIPQVTLTQFEYKKDGTVSLEGNVSDYRFLAEQLLRYRQEEMFSTAEVQNTDRTESGQINFTIIATQPVVEEPAVAPMPPDPAMAI